ncbi:MAG: type II secretion system F family protein [Betaproteobacteria bacterium]
MLLPVLVFLIGAGIVVGGYAAVTYLPGVLASRRLDARLRDVVTPVQSAPLDAIVVQQAEGPLPIVDRLLAHTNAGSALTRLLEQSGSRVTPGGFVAMTIVSAVVGAFVLAMFVRQPYAPLGGMALGALLPLLYFRYRRTARLRKFEEQFPDALDLLSRALRAGHAFQTALGMGGDELPAPVGPELKKTFDQQNFGLPLRDALTQLTDRVPLLDVRFFVTAVVIQRETGGNLSEILDNLAHVVRERFKIQRQIRVHTAHGRFTAWVLLGLPAALAVALMGLNPSAMRLLIDERMGQIMLGIAVVLQVIGYFWIQQVIKIEV